ncbi:DUF4174 domain-containing protein [Sphingomonas sp. TDK1]|uniref:DUF4174 domain-containing protein n=1 Tax=Sphingomonas sp. TDK1 TaxID=453247 RepID=UPI0007D93A2C|nr:DUF4174 domain-containing protein [Sphingomonas sp. TDK1]OAN62286.1 hypothetical protein A7X12_22630 [Sphingomonas sp. TDK1]
MTTLKLLSAMALMLGTTQSIATMQWHKRVVLISASDAEDPMLRKQRDILDHWRQGADERDIAIVEVVGDQVLGASDAAAQLRARYRLQRTGFMVLLIGKDGGVKLRQKKPLSAETLEQVIDAMPMRRAGEG